ncbi:hypothetical protein [Pseudoalteromonas rubra]|uniref:Uncharacterized protein n=1 Tax=Pseudoalteromonas rubra TaxID=43658 RepID=A0A0U3IR40_9GAMM|nr:hypothetical protein [Pseudoalteromonas rubra]ALU45788.1 hypothetical protein AT705_22940 [Pseudoalteromonas rubra]
MTYQCAPSCHSAEIVAWNVRCPTLPLNVAASSDNNNLPPGHSTTLGGGDTHAIKDKQSGISQQNRGLIIGMIGLFVCTSSG